MRTLNKYYDHDHTDVTFCRKQCNSTFCSSDDDPVNLLSIITLMLINFLCIIYAFSQLPLATAYVIIFTMPFMLNILAMFFFKEHISGYRWLAITIGFVGVLLAMRPGIEPISLAMIAAISIGLMACGFSGKRHRNG